MEQKPPHRKPLNKDNDKHHAPGRGGDKQHPDTPLPTDDDSKK